MGYENSKRFHQIIFASGIFCSILYAVTFVIDYDIFQMLERGFIFASEKRLIHYGNASSAGMGKVPGPLLSLLVGFPMFLWMSPYAPLLLLVALHVAAYGLIYQVYKTEWPSFVMVFFSILYWLNPWRVSQIFLWNPSYLFFSTALHLWSAFHLREGKNFTFSFLHILSILFAFQVHNSSIILFLITIYLVWKGHIRFHKVGVFMGLALSAAMLFPYISALFEQPELAPQIREDRFFLFRGLVYVYPILKAIWYWVLYGSFVFPKRLFQHLTFNWVQPQFFQFFFQYIWMGFIYLVGFFSVLISLKANRAFFRTFKKHFKIWTKPATPISWVKSYSIGAFWAVLVAAAMSPIDFVFWHVIIIFPIALVPVLEWIKNRWIEGGVLRSYFSRGSIALAVYFCIYNILGAFGSEKHSINHTPQQKFEELFLKKEK